jgi:hypothetical protein
LVDDEKAPSLGEAGGLGGIVCLGSTRARNARTRQVVPQKLQKAGSSNFFAASVGIREPEATAQWNNWNHLAFFHYSKLEDENEEVSISCRRDWRYRDACLGG